MQRLEVSGAVRPIYGSLGVKRLNMSNVYHTSVFTPFSLVRLAANFFHSERNNASRQTATKRPHN